MPKANLRTIAHESNLENKLAFNHKSNLENKLAFAPKCHKCNTSYNLHKTITIAEKNNTKNLKCHKCKATVGKL